MEKKSSGIGENSCAVDPYKKRDADSFSSKQSIHDLLNEGFIAV